MLARVRSGQEVAVRQVSMNDRDRDAARRDGETPRDGDAAIASAYRPPVVRGSGPIDGAVERSC